MTSARVQRRAIGAAILLALLIVGGLALWRLAGGAGVERPLELAPALLIYRRQADGSAARLKDGDPVASGDQLQLEYVAAGRPWGLIASIDGHQRVTLHHPSSPRAPPTLDTDGVVRLGHAFRLDEAPGFERFFLVTSTRPIEVRPILTALSALAEGEEAGTAPLVVPGAEVQAVLLRKRPPAP